MIMLWLRKQTAAKGAELWLSGRSCILPQQAAQLHCCFETTDKQFARTLFPEHGNNRRHAWHAADI